MKIYDQYGNLIPSIGAAVPHPPVAGSLQDILHKDTNYTYSKATDSLEAIRDAIALASVLGALGDSASSGAPDSGDTAMSLIKQLVNDTRSCLFHGRGLSAYAVVTTATSVTEFAASGLDVAHHTDDFFNGWWIYVLDADQGAPLHEWREISNFAKSGGVVTHTAFSVQLEVGDFFVIVNPVLYEVFVTTAALSTHDTDIKNLLSTIDGFHDVPSEDSGNDAQMRDVIGKKSDTTGGTSIVSISKQVKAKTDNIPASPAPADEYDTQLDQNLSTTESNIRGTDNDTLKTLSEQLDAVEGYTDGVETLVATKVMGRLQVKATTWDLNRSGGGAGTDVLLTGNTQAVILESLIIRLPNVDVSNDTNLTTISIATDDVTPGVIIDTTIGAKANLTAEAQLSWTGALYIPANTEIEGTVAGGHADAETVCNVVATYRAVASGGYLS